MCAIFLFSSWGRTTAGFVEGLPLGRVAPGSGPKSKISGPTPSPPKNRKTLVTVLDVTKPYKFIGFGAMDVTKPNKFIRFGAMDVTKPYKFIGFGVVEGQRRLDPTRALETGSSSRASANLGSNLCC